VSEFDPAEMTIWTGLGNVGEFSPAEMRLILAAPALFKALKERVMNCRDCKKRRSCLPCLRDGAIIRRIEGK
jgi:hypothetical protein